MKTARQILLALAAVLWTASAAAGLIEFTYSGDRSGCSDCSVSGIGSFSFADSPTSVELADLTGFSFVATFTDVGDVLIYTLADLTSFSATLDSAQDVTALAFLTNFVDSSSGLVDPQRVNAVSLGQVAMEFDDCIPQKDGPPQCQVMQTATGSIITSAIPEPGIIFLLILGLSALVGPIFVTRRKPIKFDAAVRP